MEWSRALSLKLLRSYARGTVVGGAVMFIVLYRFPMDKSHAQEPFVLSKEVQSVALKTDLAKRLDIKWDVERPGPGITTYLDFLTAFDLMALQRAQTLRRNIVPDNDYRAVFAALCVWPNKPPPRPGLSEFIRKIVRPALTQAYLLEKKRTSIGNAMGPLLLRETPDAIITFLSVGTGVEDPTRDYRREILDVEKIR